MLGSAWVISRGLGAGGEVMITIVEFDALNLYFGSEADDIVAITIIITRVEITGDLLLERHLRYILFSKFLCS